MTVYAVQEPMYRDERGEIVSRFDHDAASEYGEVVFLTAHQAKPHDESAILEMREKLSGFREGDWLLLAGNPCLIAAAAAIVADLTDGRIPALQYHGKQRRFIPVTMYVYD